jgi:hypothetical protein
MGAQTIRRAAGAEPPAPWGRWDRVVYQAAVCRKAEGCVSSRSLAVWYATWYVTRAALGLRPAPCPLGRRTPPAARMPPPLTLVEIVYR